MGGIELVEVVSTSDAARQAAQEPTTAAIASELASEIYQIPVVANAIMDDPNNTTRFFVIGSHAAEPSGHDRTSLFFAIRDMVGALHQALGVLEAARLNLSYLESLPSRTKPWEYVFFVEMDGHVADESVASALEKLEDLCRDVKILGSYPRGTC
jgi:chorismate mutase/prephenate dehydratase